MDKQKAQELDLGVNSRGSQRHSISRSTCITYSWVYHSYDSDPDKKVDTSMRQSMSTNTQDWDTRTFINIQTQMRPFKGRKPLRHTKINMG